MTQHKGHYQRVNINSAIAISTYRLKQINKKIPWITGIVFQIWTQRATRAFPQLFLSWNHSHLFYSTTKVVVFHDLLLHFYSLVYCVECVTYTVVTTWHATYWQICQRWLKRCKKGQSLSVVSTKKIE